MFSSNQKKIVFSRETRLNQALGWLTRILASPCNLNDSLGA